LFIVFVLFCFGQITVSGVFAQDQKEEKLPVSCLGRILPGQRVIRISAIPGSLVKEIRVKRGDLVKKGDVLAVMRKYDLMEAMVFQAEAEVDIAANKIAQVQAGEKIESLHAQQAIVNQHKALWLKAQKDQKRHQKLLESNVISQSDYDQIQTDLQAQKELYFSNKQQLNSLKHVRGEDVDTAESGLDSAMASLDRAKAELELQLIRAPMDGTILDVFTYPGESVGEKDIFTMGDLTDMQVEAEVCQTDISRVNVGDVALIDCDGLDTPLKGTIFEIGRYIDSSAIFPLSPTEFVDKRIFKVRIRLEDHDKVKDMSNSLVEVMIQP
jgi:HlyD family secretion protein